MTLRKCIIKPIAAILVLTFIFQDIVWANPEIFEKGFTPATLQIQPLSRNITTDIPSVRSLIEARLAQIFCLKSSPDAAEIIETLRRYHGDIWIRDKGITIRPFFQDQDGPRAAGVHLIRCDAFAEESNTFVTYYAVIGPGKKLTICGEAELEGLLTRLKAPEAATLSEKPAPESPEPEKIASLTESRKVLNAAAMALGRPGMIFPGDVPEPAITGANRELRKHKIFDKESAKALASGFAMLLLSGLTESICFRYLLCAAGLITVTLVSKRAISGLIDERRRRREKVGLAIDRLLEGLDRVERTLKEERLPDALTRGLPIPVINKYSRDLPDEPLMGTVEDVSLYDIIDKARSQLNHLRNYRPADETEVGRDIAPTLNEEQMYELLRIGRAGSPGIIEALKRRFNHQLPYRGIELESYKLYRALKLAETIALEADIAAHRLAQAGDDKTLAAIETTKDKHRISMRAMIDANENLRSRGSSAYRYPLIALWASTIVLFALPIFAFYLLAPYAITYLTNFNYAHGPLSAVLTHFIRWYANHSYIVTVFMTAMLALSAANWIFKDLYVAPAGLFFARKNIDLADGSTTTARRGVVDVSDPEIEEFRRDHQDLPVYTIALPAFGEPAVIKELIDSVAGLDYPPEKLDIILLPEASDTDPRPGESVSTLDLIHKKLTEEPARFANITVLTSPIRLLDEHNQAKPYATNYLLGVMRGKYLVIYDAEDRPYPRQLLEALVGFETRPDHLRRLVAYIASHGDDFSVDALRKDEPLLYKKSVSYRFDFRQLHRLLRGSAEEADPVSRVTGRYLAANRLGVLQAPLTWYNPVTLTATQFILDYGTWFNIFLPGLEALKLPVSHGGTSNHFLTEALSEVGGWDPHNVTEDAKIAGDIQQAGYESLMLNSVTIEESVTRQVRPEKWEWARQHSRWGKGFLQVFLVILRNIRERPIGMLESFGVRGIFGLMMVFGAGTYAYLFTAIFVATSFLWGISSLVVMGPVWSIASIGFSIFLVAFAKGAKLSGLAKSLALAVAIDLAFGRAITTIGHYFQMMVPHALPVIPWMAGVLHMWPFGIGIILMFAPAVTHIFYNLAVAYMGSPHQDFVIRVTIEELSLRADRLKGKDDGEAAFLREYVDKLKSDPLFYKRNLCIAAVLMPVYRIFSLLSFSIGFGQMLSGVAFYWDKTEHFGRVAADKAGTALKKFDNAMRDIHHRYIRIPGTTRPKYLRFEWAALAFFALTAIFSLAPPIRYMRDRLVTERRLRSGDMADTYSTAQSRFLKGYSYMDSGVSNSVAAARQYYDSVKSTYASSPAYLQGRIEEMIRDYMLGIRFKNQTEEIRLHIVAYMDIVASLDGASQIGDVELLKFINDLKLAITRYGGKEPGMSYLDKTLRELAGMAIPRPLATPDILMMFLRSVDDARIEASAWRIYLIDEVQRLDSGVFDRGDSDRSGVSFFGFVLGLSSVALAATAAIAILKRTAAWHSMPAVFSDAIVPHIVTIAVTAGVVAAVSVVAMIMRKAIRSSRSESLLNEENLRAERGYVARRHWIRRHRGRVEEINEQYSARQIAELLRSSLQDRRSLGLRLLGVATADIRHDVVGALGGEFAALLNSRSPHGAAIIKLASEADRDEIVASLTRAGAAFAASSLGMALETYAEPLKDAHIHKQRTEAFCDGNIRIGVGGSVDDSPCEVVISVVDSKDGSGRKALKVKIYNKVTEADTADEIARYEVESGVEMRFAWSGNTAYAEDGSLRVSLGDSPIFEKIAFSVSLSEDGDGYVLNISDHDSTVVLEEKRADGSWSMEPAFRGISFNINRLKHRLQKKAPEPTAPRESVSGPATRHGKRAVTIHVKASHVANLIALSVMAAAIVEAVLHPNPHTLMIVSLLGLIVPAADIGADGKLKGRARERLSRLADETEKRLLEKAEGANLKDVVPRTISRIFAAIRDFIREGRSSFTSSELIRRAGATRSGFYEVSNNFGWEDLKVLGLSKKGDDSERMAHLRMAIEWLNKNKPDEDINFTVISDTMADPAMWGGKSLELVKPWALLSWVKRQGGDDVKWIDLQIEHNMERFLRRVAASLAMETTALETYARDEFRKRTGHELSRESFTPVTYRHLLTMVGAIIICERDKAVPTIVELSRVSGLKKECISDIVEAIGWDDAAKLGVHKERVVTGRMDDVRQSIENIEKSPYAIMTYPLVASGMKSPIKGTALFRWLSERSKHDAEAKSLLDRIRARITKSGVIRELLKSLDHDHFKAITDEDLRVGFGDDPYVWSNWKSVNGFDLEDMKRRVMDEILEMEEANAESELPDDMRSALHDLSVQTQGSAGKIGDIVRAFKPDQIRTIAALLFNKAERLDSIWRRSPKSVEGTAVKKRSDLIFGHLIELLRVSGADKNMMSDARMTVLRRNAGIIDQKGAGKIDDDDRLKRRYGALFDKLDAKESARSIYLGAKDLLSKLERDSESAPAIVKEYAERLLGVMDELENGTDEGDAEIDENSDGEDDDYPEMAEDIASLRESAEELITGLNSEIRDSRAEEAEKPVEQNVEISSAPGTGATDLAAAATPAAARKERAAVKAVNEMLWDWNFRIYGLDHRRKALEAQGRGTGNVIRSLDAVARQIRDKMPDIARVLSDHSIAKIHNALAHIERAKGVVKRSGREARERVPNEPAANMDIVSIILTELKVLKERAIDERLDEEASKKRVFYREGSWYVRGRSFRLDKKWKTSVLRYGYRGYDTLWEAFRALDHQIDSELAERAYLADYLALIKRIQDTGVQDKASLIGDIDKMLGRLSRVRIEEKRLARIVLRAAKLLLGLDRIRQASGLLSIVAELFERRRSEAEKIAARLTTSRLESLRSEVDAKNRYMIDIANDVIANLDSGDYASVEKRVDEDLLAGYGARYMKEPDLAPLMASLKFISDNFKRGPPDARKAESLKRFFRLFLRRVEDSIAVSSFMHAYRDEFVLSYCISGGDIAAARRAVFDEVSKRYLADDALAKKDPAIYAKLFHQAAFIPTRTYKENVRGPNPEFDRITAEVLRAEAEAVGIRPEGIERIIEPLVMTAPAAKPIEQNVSAVPSATKDICIITHVFDTRGGQEAYLKGLAEAMGGKGFRVHLIYTTHDAAALDSASADGAVRYYPVYQREGIIYDLMRGSGRAIAARLDAIVKSNDIKLINLHSIHRLPSAYAACYGRLRYGIPLAKKLMINLGGLLAEALLYYAPLAVWIAIDPWSSWSFLNMNNNLLDSIMITASVEIILFLFAVASIGSEDESDLSKAWYNFISWRNLRKRAAGDNPALEAPDGRAFQRKAQAKPVEQNAEGPGPERDGSARHFGELYLQADSNSIIKDAIDMAWWSISDSTSLFSRTAQRTLNTIADMADAYLSIHLSASPEVFYRIHAAYLFGRGDHRRVIDFFERIKALRGTDPALFARIMENSRYLFIYLVARLLDPASVRMYASSGRTGSFIDYWTADLFGPHSKVYYHGATSESKKRFEISVYGSAMAFYQHYRRSSDYSRSVEIIDNLLVWAYAESERLGRPEHIEKFMDVLLRDRLRITETAAANHDIGPKPVEQNAESSIATSDGMIRQGGLAFEEMVKRLAAGRYKEMTEDPLMREDIGAIDGIVAGYPNAKPGIDLSARVIATDTVVAGPEDFCLGFYSHSKSVKNSIVAILGSEEAFTKLFPRPTVVLSNDIVNNPQASIRREYILHELICHQIGHYRSIFLQQRLFPENYMAERGVPYIQGEDGGKYEFEFAYRTDRPAKGALGALLRSAIRGCRDKIVPDILISTTGRICIAGAGLYPSSRDRHIEMISDILDDDSLKLSAEEKAALFRFLLHSVDGRRYFTVEQDNVMIALSLLFDDMLEGGGLSLTVYDFAKLLDVFDPSSNITVPQMAKMVASALLDDRVDIVGDTGKETSRRMVLGRFSDFLQSYADMDPEYEDDVEGWKEFVIETGGAFIDEAIGAAERIQGANNMFGGSIFRHLLFPACGRSKAARDKLTRYVMAGSRLRLTGEYRTASEAWSAIFDDDAVAREFFRVASLLRKVYPYKLSYADSRAPLRYAIEEGIVFQIGPGLFMTPVTESFRRHMIFSTDEAGAVRFAFEVMVPGEDEYRRRLYVEERISVSEAVRRVSEDPSVCPGALFEKRFPDSSYEFYGATHVYNRETPLHVMAFDYPRDGKRLDACTPAMIEGFSNETGRTGRELRESIIGQVARLTALTHAMGYIGHNRNETEDRTNIDHHSGNFRLIKEANGVGVTFVGDFASFETEDNFPDLVSAREDDIRQIIEGRTRQTDLALCDILGMPADSLRALFMQSYREALQIYTERINRGGVSVYQYLVERAASAGAGKLVLAVAANLLASEGMADSSLYESYSAQTVVKELYNYSYFGIGIFMILLAIGTAMGVVNVYFKGYAGERMKLRTFIKLFGQRRGLSNSQLLIDLSAGIDEARADDAYLMAKEALKAAYVITANREKHEAIGILPDDVKIDHIALVDFENIITAMRKSKAFKAREIDELEKLVIERRGDEATAMLKFIKKGISMRDPSRNAGAIVPGDLDSLDRQALVARVREVITAYGLRNNDLRKIVNKILYIRSYLMYKHIAAGFAASLALLAIPVSVYCGAQNITLAGFVAISVSLIAWSSRLIVRHNEGRLARLRFLQRHDPGLWASPILFLITFAAFISIIIITPSRAPEICICIGLTGAYAGHIFVDRKRFLNIFMPDGPMAPKTGESAPMPVEDAADSAEIAPAGREESVLAAVASAPADTPSVAPTKSKPPRKRRGAKQERFLKASLSEEDLAVSIRNAILSISLKKKVVLMFDTRLNSLQTAKAVAIFREIEELKRTNKVFEIWLAGRLEVKVGLADLPAYQSDKDAEVFVFACSDGKEISVSENTHLSLIDESQFPSDAYYPLPEIVAIALANCIDPRTIDHVRPMLGEMNIDSIVPKDRMLVFRLLPSAKRYDVQHEIYERYARFTRLLTSA